MIDKDESSAMDGGEHGKLLWELFGVYESVVVSRVRLTTRRRIIRPHRYANSNGAWLLVLLVIKNLGMALRQHEHISPRAGSKRETGLRCCYPLSYIE